MWPETVVDIDRKEHNFFYRASQTSAAPNKTTIFSIPLQVRLSGYVAPRHCIYDSRANDAILLLSAARVQSALVEEAVVRFALWRRARAAQFVRIAASSGCKNQSCSGAANSLCLQLRLTKRQLEDKRKQIFLRDEWDAVEVLGEDREDAGSASSSNRTRSSHSVSSQLLTRSVAPASCTVTTGSHCSRSARICARWYSGPTSCATCALRSFESRGR